MIAEGDLVAVRHIARCTHRGEGLGDPPIPPTNKEVTVPSISIVRFADGKIVEHWLNWDSLGLFQDLGVDLPISG